MKSKKAFVIQQRGFYVQGFTTRGQGNVLITELVTLARTFPTEAKANAFIQKYGGAGYGLSKQDAAVVPVLVTNNVAALIAREYYTVVVLDEGDRGGQNIIGVYSIPAETSDAAAREGQKRAIAFLVRDGIDEPEATEFVMNQFETCVTPSSKVDW